MKEGILVIDKPIGVTSHDVVDRVRKALKMRRIGHSGTLDPLASGVLVVLVGKATKLFSKFLNFEKAYNATLKLGQETDTGDACGKVIKDTPVPKIDIELLEQVLGKFTGDIEQVPPMVSAIRHKGKRLYKFARKGIEVPRRARNIKIKEIKLLKFDLPEIKFFVRCSSGTYIRQLGCDIAKELGCGGHISQIEREDVGPYNLKNAVKLDQVNENHIRPWQA